MQTTKIWMPLLATLASVGLMGTAAAQVTGSFDGTVTSGKLPAALDAAAVLSQVGTAVTGTLALGGDPATVGAAYLVNGKATAKRVKLSGVAPNGATLKWQAKIVGDRLAGRARVKAPGAKVAGTLALTRNPPLPDASACDAVYDQHAMQFDTDMAGLAMVPCQSCHVPGGQAEVTRFHVTGTDARATARAVAAFVDAGDPSASRILTKPLALVPHGGAQQIVPGSAEDQALRAWVALVAQSGCR